MVMIAFFRTVLGLIITIPVAVFCGLNVQNVDITYSPFHDKIVVPLYVVVLGFTLLGCLFGAFSAWLNGFSLRKERRVFAKRVKSLEKELGHLQEQSADVDTAVMKVSN